MRSIPTFLLVAAAVTLSPGPAFALVLQVAAVHGRRTALANIAGNSLGVMAWGVLSAAGVSALIAASEMAYDVLRFAGAAFLLWLGVRALVSSRRNREDAAPEGPAVVDQPSHRRSGPAGRAARRGAVNSLANPKLALFFVALFPQFVAAGRPVLPAALAMATVIVVFDVIWYGSVAFLVDRFRQVVRPRVLKALDRASGVVLVAFGLRLATEAR